MWYEQPVKDRMKLMKLYKKAHPKFSYNDMIEHFSNGGEIPPVGMTGMMKSKMATEAHYGNPAAQRMVSPYPKTGMTPEGIGTHYMSSQDNYAVPLLQDKGNSNLQFMGDNPPPSSEDIRFNSSEDAQYFSEHYKEVAPMMRTIPKFGNGGNVEGAKTYTDKDYTANKDQPNFFQPNGSKKQSWNDLRKEGWSPEKIAYSFNLKKGVPLQTFSPIQGSLANINTQENQVSSIKSIPNVNSQRKPINVVNNISNNTSRQAVSHLQRFTSRLEPISQSTPPSSYVSPYRSKYENMSDSALQKVVNSYTIEEPYAEKVMGGKEYLYPYNRETSNLLPNQSHYVISKNDSAPKAVSVDRGLYDSIFDRAQKLNEEYRTANKSKEYRDEAWKRNMDNTIEYSSKAQKSRQNVYLDQDLSHLEISGLDKNMSRLEKIKLASQLDSLTNVSPNYNAPSSLNNIKEFKWNMPKFGGNINLNPFKTEETIDTSTRPTKVTKVSFNQ